MKKTNAKRSAPASGKAKSFRLKSMLVPIDFSKASSALITKAEAFAVATGASMTLLHVIEPLEFARSFRFRVEREDLDVACRDTLGKFAREALSSGRKLPSIVVRHGLAEQEIVKAAQELKSDVILIARRSHTQFERALIGSVTERVVRSAACPVLVIPAD